MFVEHKEQGEAVPVEVGTMKLSDAIIAGSALRPSTVPGSRTYFNECGSCAIGAAYEFLTGKAEFGYQGRFDLEVAKILNIPEAIVTKASWDFETGMTREQIVEQLQAQGY